MAEAALAAFLSSERVLVFPFMVTYFGSKPLSTSTPSSRVGRSRRWPMVAFTSYPAPRYFPMVLALVGDSTITRAGLRSRRAPLPPASTLPALGLALFAVRGLTRAAFFGGFTGRFALVAIVPV